MLSDSSSAFKYNEEILHYQQSPFEFDGNNFDAHIFFNALILYAEVSRIMKKEKLFDKYTVKELFAELKKLKITHIEKKDPFLSELSKRQKIIFDAFGIQEDSLHSY